MSGKNDISQDNAYSMGPHTFSVPTELFDLNRKRLCDRLKNVADVKNNAIILLQGGSNQNFYNTDVEYIFRQEPFFFWTFGVQEPDCFGAIQVLTGDTYLFVPNLPKEHLVWIGEYPTIEKFRSKYQIKEVYYTYKIVDILKTLSPDIILTLNGINTDSGLQIKEAKFDGIDLFQVDNMTLYDQISECRVIKTKYEREVMRYVAHLSSRAHKAVMNIAKPGLYEYQCEAMFLHYVYHTGGCRHVAYNCICASGKNGSTLHYGSSINPNLKRIRDGDLCVFDMGAQYCGYSADITVTFPANGKFTEDQKKIYNAVLAANLAVQRAAKPGVFWSDMHILANKVMLEELKKINLVKGDVDKMFEAGIAAVFQPHGLGHLLGLDVHDVGGYLKGTPERPKVPGLCALRTARVLEAGMALTIEPGCYFIDALLDEALADREKSKYLNKEVINQFRGFGGVRIEDDVFITEDGIENYTKVPRTIIEIENWMNSEKIPEGK